jgi:alpha-galactosidase
VGGWYSWNQLFANVSEDDITAHVDLVAAELAPHGLPLVEIDDGWEIAWGDWRANDRFPSGMDGAAAKIKGKGLTAGVWLAPFLVDVGSQAAASADPALFVQGPDGAPLQHKPSGSNKRYFVLDGTNPASMDLAAKPIATLAAQGFTFFKLDFLYAGALPGARHDAAATSVEALHRGLDQLRAAMGEGATFNACGAPIFPLLGHADSLRIGSDTAYAGVGLNWTSVAFAARSTAARAFLAQEVWLDGDQTQVRAPYSTDEARASACVAALSGPAYALGDDLRTLPADRLAIALDPQVLDMAAAAAPATPDDPLDAPAEDVVRSPVLDAILHPGSTGAPPPAKLTMKGKSGALYELSFSWTEAHGVAVTKK